MHSVKYRWQGTREQDSMEYTVDLLFEDYGGAVNTIDWLSAENGGPWTHEIGERGDDVDTPVSEHAVKLYVVAPNGSYLSEIEDAADTEILLRIEAGADTIFMGMVEPSLGERIDSDGRNVILVTARSGLKWLENAPYPNVEDGRVSLFEHARNCLGELPFDLPFYVIDRWFPFGVTGDPFDKVEGDGIVLKDGNTPRSCRYVLEQVCGRKGLNLRQSEGAWHFQQIDALFESSTTRHEYTSAGSLDDTDTSYDGSVEYDKDAFRSPHPVVYKRTAYGQINLTYNHRKFGDAIFDNGDFSEIEGADPWKELHDYDTGDQVVEGGAIYTADQDHNASSDTRPGSGASWESFWTLSTAADDVQPAEWTTSNTDEARRAPNEELEIDAWFQPRFDPANVDSVGVWYVEQVGRSVTQGETAPGTLVFWANWIPQRQPQSGAGRPLPWTFKCGTNWWDDDNEEWTTTKVVNSANVLYGRSKHRKELAPWPETGECTIRFYAIIDNRAEFATGGSNLPNDSDSWDSDLSPEGSSARGSVRIDDVNVEIADEQGIEASSRTLSTFLASGANKKVRPYAFDFGQGPTTSHLSRLTLPDGSSADGWQYEDSFGGGSTAESLDALHSKRSLSMLRKAREAKRWSFTYLTSEVTGHKTILDSSIRHWPVFYQSTPYFGSFGGEYVRIRREGESGLTQQTAFERDSVVSIGGERTQVFAGFDDDIRASRAFQAANVIGILASDHRGGEIEELSITERTRVPIPKGAPLIITSVNGAQAAVTSEAVSEGVLTIPIEAETLNAVAGDYVVKDSQAEYAYVAVRGKQVQIGAEEYITGRAFTRLTTAIPIQVDQQLDPPFFMTFSSVECEEVNEDLEDGRLIHIQGKKNQVVIECFLDGAHSAPFTTINVADENGDPVNVNISKVFRASGFPAGSSVRIPDQHTIGQINVTAGNVSIIAGDVDDLEGDVASIEVSVTGAEASIENSVQFDDSSGETRLVAGPGGSEFVVAADQIELDGDVAVGKSIQSSNFSAGSAGWQIKGNGDAEFNDVTVRGTAISVDGNAVASLDSGSVQVANSSTGNSAILSEVSLIISNGINTSSITPSSIIRDGDPVLVQNGVDGSFTTTDGKTVTVSDGQITNIS